MVYAKTQLDEKRRDPKIRASRLGTLRESSPMKSLSPCQERMRRWVLVVERDGDAFTICKLTF